MIVPKIAVIGSANIDLISRTKRLPVCGETLPGEAFEIKPGGKGANQAVRISMSGGQSVFIGRFGNDVFAPLLRDYLLSCNVDISFSSIALTHSGIGNVILSQNGDYASVIIPGSNNEVSLDDIDAASSVIASCDAILLQLEIPIKTIEYAVNVAHSYSKKIFLNAAPAMELSDSFYKKIDTLIVNEIEAEMLTGIETIADENQLSSISRILQRYSDNVVISLGANGVFAMDRTGKSILVQAHKINVTNTIGAGDTFIGELVVRILSGTPFFESVRFANAAAASVLSSKDGLLHKISQQELHCFLDKQ